MADKIRWVKIAGSVSELDFAANGLAEVNADGKMICIAKVADEVFACAQKCPHAGGHLSMGYLDPLGNIVCPIHRYKFSVKNGRNVSGEGYYLKHWPVEVREDGVYVGMEQKSFLNLW